MVIKKGEIKHLEHKYSVCWEIFSDFGSFNEEMQKDWREDFRDNGDGSFTRIKHPKPMAYEEIKEQQRKIDEEWVVNNNSEEKDGKYFLKYDWYKDEEACDKDETSSIYSDNEIIIHNGKIDIESCLKALDEILKKIDFTRIPYIEGFEKSETIESQEENLNNKKCIKVQFGT